MILTLSVIGAGWLFTPTLEAQAPEATDGVVATDAERSSADVTTQAPTITLPLDALNPQSLRARTAALQANTELDPVVRDRAIEIYEAALTQAEAARLSAETAERFRATLTTAVTTTASLREQIEQRRASPAQPADSNDPPPNSPMEQLELARANLLAEQASLRTQDSEAADRLQVIRSRSTSARTDMQAARQALLELEPTLNAQAPAVVQEAQKAFDAAHRRALQERINALEQEVASMPARETLAQTRRVLLGLELSRLDVRLAALDERISRRRQQDARRRQAEAEQLTRAIAGAHPMLTAYASTSAEFAGQTSDVISATDLLRREVVLAQARLDDFANVRDTAEQVMAIGGDNLEFGQVLRELRARLPSIPLLSASISQREAEVVTARLQQLRLTEQRRRLADREQAINEAVEAWISSQTNGVTAPPPSVLERLAGLVEARERIITELLAALRRQIDIGGQLNALEKELAGDARLLSEAIDTELLWLPSTSMLGRSWLGPLTEGVAWLTSRDHWARAGAGVWRRSAGRPLEPLLMALIVTGLLVIRRRLRAALIADAGKVGRFASDGYLLTPQALLATALLAAPGPVLVWATGWLMSAGGGSHPFPSAVGASLQSTAVLLFILVGAREAARDRGLFDAHFGWSTRSRRVLKRNLIVLIALLTPVSFIVGAAWGTSDPALLNGVGRVAFIAGSMVLSLFCLRVFHPEHGAVADALVEGRQLWRTRRLWFPLVVAAPAVLAVVAALGYFDTAARLQGRLFTTLWTLLLAIVVYSTGLRSVVVAHRRLAVFQARERRDKLNAERASREDVESSGEAAPNIEIPEVDLSTVSEQTRNLLSATVTGGFIVSLWMIWNDVAPILNALESVTLWSNAVITDDGDELLTPITAWSVLLAMISLTLTWIAARNVPGFIEMTVMRKLSLDAGASFAMATISRYIIVGIGVVVAIEQIGLNWSQAQWIVAALGVGLGFGLQEIVANFVSGVIILFERPIRVGDAVTVGDLSGTVSRIKIRATTIVDWDNREIIVPNKNFITNTVVNWTLSDPVTRLVIPVGIAYGSDTTLAQRVMLDVARQNPSVLETPTSTVLFLGFGASSLDFEVRVFVAGLSKRMPTLHELHMALDQALREHDIEIAFPQRDLHLRSGWPPAPPDAPPDASSPPAPADEPAPATEPGEAEPDKPSPGDGRS